MLGGLAHAEHTEVKYIVKWEMPLVISFIVLEYLSFLTLRNEKFRCSWEGRRILPFLLVQVLQGEGPQQC